MIVLFPDTITEYLQAFCIITLINKNRVPTTMTTQNGKTITINWDVGRAWDVLQDIRLALVTEKGETLLVLHTK